MDDVTKTMDDVTNNKETEEKAPLSDKKFPLKFTGLMLAVCILGIALSVAGFVLTSWQFARFCQSDLSSALEWMKFILLYGVSIALLVLLVAMLFRSQYVVKEKTIVMQFGFIKQRYDIGKIYSVHLFRGTGRLAVYFDDFKTKYIMILVKESWYKEFTAALKERNDRIEFTFSTPEEEEDAKKK